MRYLLIVLAFVSGMLCTERAVASEAEDFYEYASYFHGTWISEQEGSESIVVCEAKATYNLCSFNGGMAHEIWGYDPVKKVWAGYGRGGDSSWELLMARPVGDSLSAGVKSKFKGKMLQADGTALLMKQVLNVIDKDNCLLEQRTLQADGQEEVAQPTIKLRRVQ